MGKARYCALLVLVGSITVLVIEFGSLTELCTFLVPNNYNRVDYNDIFYTKRRFGGGTNKKVLVANHLPQDVINRVEKFVFFVGYPRSGHSIVGSFIDAHPHMVIAHEFMLFKRFRVISNGQDTSKFALLYNKSCLYNTLYRSSVHESMTGWRSETNNYKHYTLAVESPWLGKYDGYISIIGDKSGGMTANEYNLSPENFTAHFRQLQQTLGIPIKVIHCIRNPYDMVSTNTLYAKGITIMRNPKFPSSFKSNMSKLRNTAFTEARFDNETLLERKLELLERQAGAVTRIVELVGADNVLELHNSDLVNDPKSVLGKLCTFLEVECFADYLQACSKKVFKSVSKSRDLVVWSERLRSKMKSIMKQYTFFHGYSFESI